jgi:hypothetical protein
MPIHYLSSLDIPDGAIDVMDRARRHCLWRKIKYDEKAHSLASSEMVCKPKKKGGLGVINLKFQNKCLILKHFTLFIIKQICLGSCLLKTHITMMKCHMQLLFVDPSGGGTS